MYITLKNVLKQLLPTKFIRKYESTIRSMVSIFYIGNKYVCNICGFTMRKFILLGNGNEICPKCGSLPRGRRLWQIIEPELEGKSILHFSPSKSLKIKISKIKSKNYVTSDYEDEFEADKNYNIQQIDEKDNEYDIIICFHILEHIPNDLQAMSELYRVLRPKGKCLIQTPFKDGEIYEDNSITTPEGRLEHFGQNDHLRIYSIDGLKSRLESVGFEVEILNFVKTDKDRFGLKSETVIVANK